MPIPVLVSLPDVLVRIDELQRALQPVTAAPPAPPASFAGTLDRALAPAPTAAPGLATTAPVGALAGGAGTPAGQAVLNLVRGELGVTEQPPGSNDSPRIAQYRQATAGSGVGPWCAYFVSWAAREAGAPLGESGQGFGAVADVWSWGQRSGKAIPNGDGVRPQPGDLIVWSGHIGVVESVGADGSVNTIEGNSSHMVARRRHGPGGDGALGYVRLG